jgi:hypothetical protein
MMMTCDCSIAVQNKLLENFKINKPDWQEHSANLDGYGFVMLNSELKTVGVMPLKLTWKETLKNGSVKFKKRVQSVSFTYCPFCGVKY